MIFVHVDDKESKEMLESCLEEIDNLLCEGVGTVVIEHEESEEENCIQSKFNSRNISTSGILETAILLDQQLNQYISKSKLIDQKCIDFIDYI